VKCLCGCFRCPMCRADFQQQDLVVDKNALKELKSKKIK
jgi:hypothetical protein